MVVLPYFVDEGSIKSLRKWDDLHIRPTLFLSNPRTLDLIRKSLEAKILLKGHIFFLI